MCSGCYKLKNHEFLRKKIDKFQNHTIFSALKSNFLDFGLDHSVGDTPLYIKKIFCGGHDGVFKSYLKKLKKLKNSEWIFLYLYWHILQNHFTPTPDFFITLFRSYSLRHGVVVLFLSHLPSELDIFFYFGQKND